MGTKAADAGWPAAEVAALPPNPTQPWLEIQRAASAPKGRLPPADKESNKMKKLIVVAGLALVTLAPSLASAQSTCQERRDNRVVGTVVGATIGALLGRAVGGRDKTAETIVGGLGGGLVGNRLSRPGADCAHAYGYYDNNRVWHSNARTQVAATGYYDRNGEWIDGAPDGYYDASGHWIDAASPGRAGGYYDAQRRWTPASAQGHYASNGSWVGGSATGYYDRRGRWIAGPTSGYYTSEGRWIRGQNPGRNNADGVWVADPHPGYYDTQGRWVRGPVTGYYDGRGRWVTTAAAPRDRGERRQSYGWMGAEDDTRAREAWFDRRIRQLIDDRALSRSDGAYALRALDDIREDDRDMRQNGGGFRRDEQRQIQDRLDTLARELNL